jgi:hypothetical protein
MLCKTMELQSHVYFGIHINTCMAYVYICEIHLQDNVLKNYSVDVNHNP